MMLCLLLCLLTQDKWQIFLSRPDSILIDKQWYADDFGYPTQKSIEPYWIRTESRLTGEPASVDTILILNSKHFGHRRISPNDRYWTSESLYQKEGYYIEDTLFYPHIIIKFKGREFEFLLKEVR